MQIAVIKYGESVFNENYIFQGGSPEVMCPISFVFYLIRTEDKNVLVDVGCNDGAGFVMSIFAKPADALRDYGLEPEEITDVILTHSHHDHVEAVADFPNAVIHIQKEEYESTRKYIPEGRQVHLFEEVWEALPGLTVKKIGGHSAGSSIVLANCDGRQYVLCGDECYVQACFERQIVTGASCNLEASERFIREYGSEEYCPLLFHDPSILRGSLGYQVIAED